MRINISSIKINVQVRPFQLYVHFVVAVKQDRNVDGRWTFTFCVTARKYKREKKRKLKKGTNRVVVCCPSKFKGKESSFYTVVST